METIQLEATVKSIRKDKTAAQLIYLDQETGEERTEWFSLAEVVQNYVKPGKCKVKISLEPDDETGNRVLLFFQFVASAVSGARPITNGFKKPFTSKPTSNVNQEETSSTNEAMTRMSALKNAGMIYQGTGMEEDFKRLTTEIIEFIDTGLWISHQKVGANKNEKESVHQGELSE
jgi:hypothetical protein